MVLARLRPCWLAQDRAGSPKTVLAAGWLGQDGAGSPKTVLARPRPCWFAQDRAGSHKTVLARADVVVPYQWEQQELRESVMMRPSSGDTTPRNCHCETVKISLFASW